MNYRPPRSVVLLTFLVLISSQTLWAQAKSGPGQDKYALKVPGGLAFAEFKGYESWQVISVSNAGPQLAVIMGNQIMIDAYKAGIPGNGKPFPDGARMAKVHWVSKPHAVFPEAKVPGPLHDVDFMVKDSKRFKDGNGWGYAAFIYDTAGGKYRPGNADDKPPQLNDAKCGVTCHSIAKNTDYVFTVYQPR